MLNSFSIGCTAHPHMYNNDTHKYMCTNIHMHACMHAPIHTHTDVHMSMQATVDYHEGVKRRGGRGGAGNAHHLGTHSRTAPPLTLVSPCRCFYGTNMYIKQDENNSKSWHNKPAVLWYCYGLVLQHYSGTHVVRGGGRREGVLPCWFACTICCQRM